jgi:hypothetical protein
MLNTVDRLHIALDSFLIKGEQGRRCEGKHGERRHECVRERNPRSFSAIIQEAGKAVSNQAKERIGGEMFAAFGSGHRHRNPHVQEGNDFRERAIVAWRFTKRQSG